LGGQELGLLRLRFTEMDLKRKRQEFIERAEEAANKASGMKNREVKATMQGIADLYRDLARQAEELAETRKKNETGLKAGSPRIERGWPSF
jgi:hypothetical protein